MTGAHDTVLDHADLFSVTLHDDNIQEFGTRWDEVLLSMSKIPSDDILESLYKLRRHEFAQLKTVLELYDMEIHQKMSMPNCQKLKTMVKRSTAQKLRSRNFDARHVRIETGAVVTNRVFVYNLGAICDKVALSQQMVSEWSDIFEPLGLALHKTEERTGRGEALGTELDGRKLSSRVTSKRFWMMRQGLTALGTCHRPLHFRGSRVSRNVLHISHLLP